MDLRVRAEKQLGAFHLGIDLDYQGGCLGIFGKSGCGKTTLANLLAGLIHSDYGTVSLNGEILEESSRRFSLPPEARRIGLVFQKPHLFPHLSVRGNLFYGYKRRSAFSGELVAEPVMRQLDLEPILHRRIACLSGGEQQRVSLGRAVLADPRLLILDEPVSALDEGVRYKTLRLIRELCCKRKISYIYISHSPLEMRLMTDQVAYLADGRIEAQLTPGELERKLSGAAPTGSLNLLSLKSMNPEKGLWQYSWGKNILLLVQATEQPTVQAVLSSRDVILFTRHPHAISARNLLACQVKEIVNFGSSCRVTLDCHGQELVAEVVIEARMELKLFPGKKVYAAVKASAFKILD